MKMSISLLQTARATLLLALAGCLLAGCKTTPKVDWNSRIGSYTFDQAVTDMGPPDKSAKLSDGKTVAEWYTRSSGVLSFGLGTSTYGSHSAVGVGQSATTGGGVHVLRLVLGADNKLESWSRDH